MLKSLLLFVDCKRKRLIKTLVMWLIIVRNILTLARNISIDIKIKILF